MSKATALLLLGGGTLVTAAGVWLGKKKMDEVTDAIQDGVDAPPVPLPPSAPIPQEISAKLPTFIGKLTGYWPLVSGLSVAERKMEGGTKDRLGHPIMTLEMHQSDPVKYPYVSVSGDYTIFPAGQRLVISTWPDAIFRVVDTGSHFHGINKVFRLTGSEPLDIAVNSSKTPVPHTPVSVKIVPGDTFIAKKGPAEVLVSKLKDQTVTFTGELKEGRTKEDYEALARALESELSGRTRDEMVAAAWTMKNRADILGLSLKQMLAPKRYGTTPISGGYASTRKGASALSKEVADAVLEADPMYDITGGATDFWIPSQQAKMHQLGDVYRAAKKNGDISKSVKYAKYAKYGSEGDVRVGYAKKGLRPVFVVGSLECLKKI